MEHELILHRNPRGGRPQALGKRLLIGLERNYTDISEIRAYSEARYMLGYCPCGKKIVMGEEAARKVMGILLKNNVEPEKEMPIGTQLRARIAGWLLPPG